MPLTASREARWEVGEEPEQVMGFVDLGFGTVEGF